uniref:Aminoglycoside phosphotransferase family protein n=1 Tax=Streptomyces sp. NBC_00093 TaxID=2975649 RepID=A0AAU2A2U3_9ACTN
MGTPPAPHPTVYGLFVELACKKGELLEGHHNSNYVLALTPELAQVLRCREGRPVMVRIPRCGLPVVAVKTWPDEEARILDAIRSTLPGVPQCLTQDWGKSSLFDFVLGRPLSGDSPRGTPVDRGVIATMAGILASLTLVPLEKLPPLPPGWPQGDDSRAFLRHLIQRADRVVRLANTTVYGPLFRALGIPDDGLRRMAGRVPRMTSRPYSVLHGDLHRANVIVTADEPPRLIPVDWELATYGDPLHDLAIHLVRMGYPEGQAKEAIEAWAEAMRRVSPASVRGLDEDLPQYLAFERAQSVYPDVIRAAYDLERSPDPRQLVKSVRSVHRALTAAAEPLALRDVPDEGEIEEVLVRWTFFRLGAPVDSGRETEPVHWKPGRDHPHLPEFTDAQVTDALLAERSAAARNVRTGTADVNPVVRVRGRRDPVLVRRPGRTPSPRREPGLHAEHVVLQLIENAGVPVAVPRVLAMGDDGDPAGPFLIHTYVGQGDGGTPPRRPLSGLRLYEADDLVDQLCALTAVDYFALDPTATAGVFYERMTDRLVRLVDALPDESRRLAERSGLPGPDRLHRILSRYRVSPRTPTLLHGDLRLWNLVRLNEERFSLALVDWERAMVGDPLYDLVRHFHLARSRPVMRHRMLRRWELTLPPHYTRDWRRDRRTYHRLEIVRSAYVDLDRLATRTDLEALDVGRAVVSVQATVVAALTALNLEPGPIL